MGIKKLKRPVLKKLLNRLWFNSRQNGPYRFLVRNWSGITDLNVIAEALSTETFRSSVRPKALPVKQAKSIIVLAPHQDDELIGAGGMMLMAHDNGIAITIVFVTDGAQNNLTVGGKTLSPAEIVTVRENEARSVCDQLNARYECLGVDNISMAIDASHIASLNKLIQETNADLVLTPWLFDGSRKHRAVNQILMHALSDANSVREVWGYQVNNTPFANGYIDVSEWIEEKISLLELYTSQNEGIRRYEHMTRGLNAWNSRFLPSKNKDQRERYAEIFFAVPVHEYLSLIKTHYLRDMKKTYFDDKGLITTMSNLQNNAQN